MRNGNQKSIITNKEMDINMEFILLALNYKENILDVKFNGNFNLWYKLDSRGNRILFTNILFSLGLYSNVYSFSIPFENYKDFTDSDVAENVFIKAYKLFYLENLVIEENEKDGSYIMINLNSGGVKMFQVKDNRILKSGYIEISDYIKDFKNFLYIKKVRERILKNAKEKFEKNEIKPIQEKDFMDSLGEQINLEDINIIKYFKGNFNFDGFNFNRKINMLLDIDEYKEKIILLNQGNKIEILSIINRPNDNDILSITNIDDDEEKKYFREIKRINKNNNLTFLNIDIFFNNGKEPLILKNFSGNVDDVIDLEKKKSLFDNEVLIFKDKVVIPINNIKNDLNFYLLKKDKDNNVFYFIDVKEKNKSLEGLLLDVILLKDDDYLDINFKYEYECISGIILKTNIDLDNNIEAKEYFLTAVNNFNTEYSKAFNLCYKIDIDNKKIFTASKIKNEDKFDGLIGGYFREIDLTDKDVKIIKELLGRIKATKQSLYLLDEYYKEKKMLGDFVDNILMEEMDESEDMYLES